MKYSIKMSYDVTPEIRKYEEANFRNYDATPKVYTLLEKLNELQD